MKRTIRVKYAGVCACCGVTIKAGEMADWYSTTKQIAHIGGLEGNSGRCASNLRDKATNDYAGDGLDARWEDQCRDMCGL